MSKLKNILLCALLILILADFTKTGKDSSVESSLLVSGLCFDITDEGMYDVAFLYTVPSSDSAMQYKALRAVGKSIGECISITEKNTENRLLFGQTDVVFISEKAVKIPGFYKSITDYLQRNTSIGYSVHLYCMKENTDEFVRSIASDTGHLTDFLDSIIMKEPSSGQIILTLSGMVSSHQDYALPCVSTMEESLSQGIVCMGYENYICELGEEFTRAYKIFTRKKAQCYYNTDLGEFVTDKVKCRLSYHGGKEFSVDVDIKFSSLLLYEYHSLQGKMIGVCESLLSKAVKKDCEILIAKMQEMGADLIGINEYMHRFHHAQKALFDEEGIDILREGDFTVNVTSHFANNGIMY